MPMRLTDVLRRRKKCHHYPYHSKDAKSDERCGVTAGQQSCRNETVSDPPRRRRRNGTEDYAVGVVIRKGCADDHSYARTMSLDVRPNLLPRTRHMASLQICVNHSRSLRAH